MMKYAKIENNVVVQTQPNEETGFIKVPDNVCAGMIKKGKSFENPKTKEELSFNEIRAHAWQKWDGSEWVVDSQLFDDDFKIQLKQYRDLKINMVVSVNNPKDTYFLDAINNDENRNVIMGIINLFMIANDENMTIDWKGESGFQVGRLQDFQGLVLAGGLLTQKAFTAEKTILENHAQTPYTDDSWKIDFDTAMEA